MKEPTLRTAQCGEFPNDNKWLHRGYVWREFDGERSVLFVRAGMRVSTEPDAAADAGQGAGIGAATSQSDFDCDDEPVIEVVDELTFADTIDEAPLGGDMEDDLPSRDGTPEAGEAPAAEDAYATFVAAMGEVAQAFGAAPDGIVRLRALLGQARVEGVTADGRAAAWQGIIQGESEDFGPCGAETLDEWAAGIVASIVSGAGRGDAIRRELRGRGVAAFGFMAPTREVA